MIPNDRLLSISDRNVSVLDAFKQADQVLLQGVSGITDLITTPGLINLDFADVKSVMANAGSALMGIGSARGEDRVGRRRRDGGLQPAARGLASTAPTACCSRSPVAPTSACSRSTRRPRWWPQAAHPEANIIFGATIDDALGDEVRVTVIAAGFDGGMPKRRDAGSALRARRSRSRPRRRPARPPRRWPRRSPPARRSRRPVARSPWAPPLPDRASTPAPSSPAPRERRSRCSSTTTTSTSRLPEVGRCLYSARLSHGPVELAFTDRHGGVSRVAVRLAQPRLGRRRRRRAGREPPAACWRLRAR